MDNNDKKITDSMTKNTNEKNLLHSSDSFDNANTINDSGQTDSLADNKQPQICQESLDRCDKLIVNDDKKRKKTIITYTTFIIINTLVVLGLILFENKSGDKATGRAAFAMLANNWWYTAIFLAMFGIIIVGDSIVFGILLRKMSGKKHTGLAIKVSILGRYYDRLTPWAMGGEPFQIAYLVSGGIPAGESGAITMSRHIIRFFTVAIAVIIILAASTIATNIYVMIAAIFSILLGLAVPAFMLLCSIKPHIGQKIGRGIIGLLFKLKLIKNYDKQLARMQSEIDNFLTGIKYIAANKRVIFVVALVSLTELFAVNSVPFFVMKALNISVISYWKTLVLCLFVNYSSSFAPTPGGAGIAELSFYAIFAAFLSESYIFWAVLFWRIAIFYLPVFIGFVLQNTESIIKIIKARKKDTKTTPIN